MKRLLYIVIGVAFLLISCDKEVSSNGHLDGFWQMTQLTDKSKVSVADMRSSGITWAFQGHILELRDVNKVHQDVIMSFAFQNGKLLLSAPYRVDRDSDDVSLKDANLLSPYGITNTSVEFDVIELSASRLVLDDSSSRLEFRKY